MYPKAFEYHKAREVNDALEFMENHEDCKLLAGGQSLVPTMKLGILRPSCLVDISQIDSLRYARLSDDGTLRIGALLTHTEVEESPVIKENFSILSSTAEKIGDVQVRNLGTIGGSICHADPSADYFPTLLILNAKVTVRSKSGRRTIPLEDFVAGAFTTGLDKSEILEEVVIPPYNGRAAAEKFARRKADFAIVSVAALLDLNGNDVRELRVAVGCQNGGAKRLKELETEVKGKAYDKIRLRQSIEKAVKGLEPLSDVNGSQEYRRDVTKTILMRAIENLYEPSGREEW